MASGQTVEWYGGALSDAANEAAADQKVLVVCMVEDAEQRTELELELLTAKEDINAENIAHRIKECLDDKTSNNVVSAPSTPTSPSTALDKDHDTVDWQAREAERLRKKLAKQRSQDAVYIKQLRANIKDDRKTYQYIHSNAPAAEISRQSSAANLADVSAGNTTETKECRLLFRAKGGQTISGDFAADATLGQVRIFLERRLGLRKDRIEVSRFLPRVTLGSDCDAQTLQELRLVPSATLLLSMTGKPKSNARVRTGMPLRPLLLVSALLVLFWAALAHYKKTTTPNEFGVVNGHVERQLKLYGGLAQLIAEKAAAEKEYGRKLMELSRSFQSQLSSINNSQDETSNRDSVQSGQQTENPEHIELFPAARKWALYLEGEGNLHVKLSAAVSSNVVEELQKAIGSLDGTRKQNLEFYHRLLAERDTVYAVKDSMKGYFDSRYKILTTTRNKLERATSEREQEKLRKMSMKHKSKCNHAKNEYILQVAKANAVKHATNYKFTPQIMNSMQVIDEQRVAVTKRLLLRFMEAQTSIYAKMVGNAKETTQVLHYISPNADSEMFVRRRLQSGASKWDEPPDFRVVVDVANGDTDQMPMDGESQVILRNLCIHTRINSQKSEVETREKMQAVEKSRQRILAGTDDCENEIANAASAERKAILAEFEIVQSQALCAMVEEKLGPVASGCPHKFKQTSITISKTCDCCGKSIGGLRRKAAKCTECGYLCHAKCQIKVEPNCPGRDPNAKKGFLSLFRKRSKHKNATSSQAYMQESAAGAGAEAPEANESLCSEEMASTAPASAAVQHSVPELAAGNMPSPIPKSIANANTEPHSWRLSAAPNLDSRTLYDMPDRNAATMHPSRSQNMAYQLPDISLQTVAPYAMQNTPALGSAFTHVYAAAQDNTSGTRPPVAKNTSAGSQGQGQEPCFALTSHHRNQSTPLLGGSSRNMVNMNRISVSNVVRRDSSIQNPQPGSTLPELNTNAGASSSLSQVPETSASTMPYTLQQRLHLQLQQLRQLQQPPSDSTDTAQPIFTTEISDSESEVSFDDDDGHEYVVALFGFTARSAEELTFVAGDRIRVVARDIGGGWMRGILNGHEGRLPQNYIKNE
ncbi:Protein BZZ1 [Coemansia sp. RSA 486]|nr:Protein BZZ1 [Coemansia sp. RSA 486]